MRKVLFWLNSILLAIIAPASAAAQTAQPVSSSAPAPTSAPAANASFMDSIKSFFDGIVTMAKEDTLRLVFYVCIAVLIVLWIVFIISKLAKSKKKKKQKKEKEETKKEIRKSYQEENEQYKDILADEIIAQAMQPYKKERPQKIKKEQSAKVNNVYWQDKASSSLKVDIENPSQVVEKIFKEAAAEAKEKGEHYMKIKQYRLAMQFFEEYIMCSKSDKDILWAEMQIVICLLNTNKQRAAEYRILQIKKKKLEISENQREKLNKLLEMLGSAERL